MVGNSKVVQRESCPTCGSRSRGRVFRESYGGNAVKAFFESHYEGRADASRLAMFDFEVVRCKECSLAYQTVIPSAELLGEIYDKWIPQSERERLRQSYTLDDCMYWSEQVQFLIRYVGLKPAAISIFDFGMGWGEWAEMAKAFGCNVSGLELSQLRMDHARSIGIEPIGWDDIPGRRFQFINTEQVFEHLVDPLGTLKHLIKGLDSGGLIKISVPDSRRALRAAQRVSSLSALSPMEVMPITPLEHINCFEADSLIALAARAGLRPVRPPLGMLFNSSSGWFQPRRAARLLLRPFYRHWYPKSTFMYFTRDSRQA